MEYPKPRSVQTVIKNSRKVLTIVWQGLKIFWKKSSKNKTTKDLNQAAFYATFKAPLLSINGKYPDNTFTFEVSGFIDWYEDIGGFVPYNQFCHERQKLKEKTRKLAGLPARFTGKKEYGFKLMDLIPNVMELKKRYNK